ncbi:putative zinc transporter msc2 [Sporothrix stenoceras]|uniref:Zinc transporter n=1 Tax=Sporothrix stenoceras TaxID=5173 RepID=A0ABR3YL29_9PEZI
MASSYGLPGASISPPKSHLPGFMQHSHSHSNGHSHHGHSHTHSHSSQTHSPSPLALGRSPPASSVSHLGGSYSRSHRRVNNSSGVALRGGNGHNFSFDQNQTQTPSHSHNDSHDHGNGHSHSDPHSHAHDHDHDHDHDHSRDHDHDHSHGHSHSHAPSLSGAGPYTPSRSTFDKSSYAAPETSSVAFDQSAAPGSLSRFSEFAMQYTAHYPLVHAVMKEKDSRRIFYFMSLNFAFMIVQAFYGYVTDSLGLLSDSIHMFFDCVALAVGLFAAVASKWPPSERFPYGFGKIETLSGFANGIFLILISVEIMVEAVERLMGGRETQRLMELFVVSTLGLLVNLVGMMSFGHHHHHGHGGHSHSHGEHADDFSSLTKKNDSHDHAGHDHSHSHDHGHDHGHGHSHDNENMYGIYLHVLADTLGSAAVIVSTVLTHFWSWSGWDPLASFLIAVLILGSAVPLVTSSARRLLLTIPDAVEYSLRETLAGVPGLRGVASYSAPKFWIDDRAGTEDKFLGVMHVVAARGADMEDVRDRVRSYMLEKGIDAVVQVERDGDGNCWCGSNRASIAMGHAAKPSINF